MKGCLFMKAKTLLTFALTAVMAMTATVTVAAEGNKQLTKNNQSDSTEVRAHIDAATGAVNYIIEIPEVVDFGNLTQPETNDNSYIYKKYDVTAVEIKGLAKDQQNNFTQQVSVYVKDENATTMNSNFYIANTDSAKDYKLQYHVFDTTNITETTPPLSSVTMSSEKGYFLKGFTEEGQAVNGTLVLNQNQLFGKDLEAMSGDYNGHMVFYSEIADKT